MIKKTKRKNDIKFPIINYKDSNNNPFEYTVDDWEIKEVLEDIINENTTQNNEGLIYINNDENYTCNEDCFEEQLANYIAERVKELFISYYDVIKEKLQEQALNYHNNQMAENDLDYYGEQDLISDSKVPEFGRKSVNFDIDDITIDGDFSTNTQMNNLAKQYGIEIDKIRDGSFPGTKELIINSGTFENIIKLFKDLGVIKGNKEIGVSAYYDSGVDIYPLDQVLNKAEKTNVYLASYIFNKDKDLIQVVGTPENIDRFLEDTITNYDVATEMNKEGKEELKPDFYPYSFEIELRDYAISLLRSQPLKFKTNKQAGKYLGKKDEETEKEFEKLYNEDFTSDEIDDVTDPDGDFYATLKTLFNSRYTIKFHKEPYLTTDIGIYDSIYKAWFACLTFAITYSGDISAFKDSDFYKENAIEEEVTEGKAGYQQRRTNQAKTFSNGKMYQVRPIKTSWYCEGKDVNGSDKGMGSFPMSAFTKEEAERYCAYAYEVLKQCDFDTKGAFKQSDVYKNRNEIAKGEYTPEVETNQGNIYEFSYNIFLNEDFNDEIKDEKTFRELARRLNVNVSKFEMLENGNEANFTINGLKDNVLKFINVLLDFDFDNEQEEIDYLVSEGYLKIM